MGVADEMVLVAESQTEVTERFQRWKTGTEFKRLRMNVDKTKILVSRVGGGDVKEEDEWPCSICWKSSENKSILCNVYHKWVHKRCTGIKGKLQYVIGFEGACVGEYREVGSGMAGLTELILKRCLWKI